MSCARTVRAATHDLLRQLGLTTIFGNPGSTEIPFFNALPEDFRYVLGLQEASVVGMAEGFAQATGSAVLVNLHTAPGVGNAMGAIISAFHHKVPLIVTAGQQVRAFFELEPFLFSRDATDLPKPYVKWSHEPRAAADVPWAMARAHAIALSRPRGPVFLSLPMDDWEREAGPFPVPEVLDGTPPDPTALDRLTRELAGAGRPCLVVGADIDRENAWSEVQRLAEKTGADVWGAALQGRASFPEDHPQFRGFLPPAQAGVLEKLTPYDVVLVIGAPVFTYYPYVPAPRYIPDGARLFHLTDDPMEASRAAAGTGVVASVRRTLQALADRLPDRPAETRAPSARPQAPAATEPLTAAYVISRLAHFAGPDTVLVDESPSTRPALQRHYPITRPRSFYTTSGGGLGFGLPAAIGIALADPRRPVVALLGDGSFFYSVQALWTAAQLALPVTFVVLDNGEYAILKAFGKFLGADPTIPGLDLPGKDPAAVAAGLGVESVVVETTAQLEEQLPRALAARKPRLVRVKVAQERRGLLG